MMGSKEEDVPVEPTEKTNFIEDLSEAERNTLVSVWCWYQQMVTLIDTAACIIRYFTHISTDEHLT